MSSPPSPSKSPSITKKNDALENVLILQGGGSLGAFGCGVFKALAKNNIKIDIIAGTSIGGINAAIMAGSKVKEHSAQLLEQFWLELSESYIDLDKFAPYHTLSQQIEHSISPNFQWWFPPLSGTEKYFTNRKEHEVKLKQIRSFYSSAIFGNDKMFLPRWTQKSDTMDPEYFSPQTWTYMYDHSPLAKTLEKYIDYDRLKPGANPDTRLILTAVNVLNAQPLVFDSFKQQITPKHILATSAYPMYNFRWIEVEKGVFAWDGGLLSNTPLREVIDASPINDKKIFLVENYPKNIDSLPENLPEVHHRARDIMFSDKTEYNVTMSKVITRYLSYIEELYKIIENNVDKIDIDEKKLRGIRRKYRKYKQEHGAEIKGIYYISRDEPFPGMYENADFAPETIKYLIKEGEEKTDHVLKDIAASKD
jgi:NTE family protein